MRRLFTSLLEHKTALTAVFVLATLNQTLLLVEPQLARLLIDRYVMRASLLDWREFLRGTLMIVGASLVIALVARMARKYQEYWSQLIAQRVSARLYADTIGHALLLPFNVLEDRQSGDLLQKFDKARTDTNDSITRLVTIYLGALALLLVTCYAFRVHWSIGALYVFLAVILGGFVLVVSRPIRARQKEIARQSAALAGAATETIRNLEIVKSHGLERQETDRLRTVSDQIVGLAEKKMRLIRSFGFAEGTAANLCRAAILICMLWLVFNRQITVGEFLTLFLYSQSVFAPLSELATTVTRYQEARANFEHVDEILDLPPEAKPPGVRLPSLVHVVFDRVSLRYGAVTALDGIDLELREGETVALVGPSGAGKSSVARLLVGLYAPSAGAIRWNGIDSRDVSVDEVRQRVGIVTQDTQLFSGTVRENLLFARADASDRQCLIALSRAAALPIIERDDGLDTRIGEGGLKLSGGERQRLAIARALLRDPELLVFDEATSNLDSLTEKSITSTIAEVARHGLARITLIVAHRLSTVAHADRIVTLARGRIVETGTHAALVESGGLYARMWRQQGGEAAH